VLTLAPAFVETEPSGMRSLLDRARAGDAEAFCELCRAYETPLLRQAMMVCGNATLAEELVQDTLVEAWKCLRRYNGRCRLFTWLCAILLNRYRNSIRDNRWTFTLDSRALAEFTDAVTKLTDHTSLPDEAAELRDDLGKLVEELEDTCQKFELAKERRLEREKKVAEKKATKNLLVTASASAAS